MTPATLTRPDGPGASAGAPPWSSTFRGAHTLFGKAYPTLKALARRVRAHRAGATLGTTALVHEAYLKLADHDGGRWHDERHFLAVAARAMRQVIVDTARRERAGKRGGGEALLTFDEGLHLPSAPAEEILALDDALQRLQARDPRRASVVEHRVFGGHSIPETARLLGLSTATVERDWRTARAWLAAELAEPARKLDR